MKKIITLIILFTFLFSGYIHAQKECKYMDSDKMPEAATSNTCFMDSFIYTKTQTLYIGVSYSASMNFVKSVDGYYLYLEQTGAQWGRSFEIAENNSLDIYFKNGDELELYPCKNLYGKHVLGTYLGGCYYTISEAQLKIMAENPLDYMHVHFINEKKIWTSKEDKNGNRYFEIKTSKLARPKPVRNGVMASANCILSL